MLGVSYSFSCGSSNSIFLLSTILNSDKYSGSPVSQTYKLKIAFDAILLAEYPRPEKPHPIFWHCSPLPRTRENNLWDKFQFLNLLAFVRRDRTKTLTMWSMKTQYQSLKRRAINFLAEFQVYCFLPGLPLHFKRLQQLPLLSRSYLAWYNLLILKMYPGTA